MLCHASIESSRLSIHVKFSHILEGTIKWFGGLAKGHKSLSEKEVMGLNPATNVTY